MDAETNSIESLRQCLIRISTELSGLAPILKEEEARKCETDVSHCRRSVIPQLGSDFPLLVAVTGAGSTGKSSVFNALVGSRVSAADPTAGYTKRMVAAIHPEVVRDTVALNCLFERFHENSRPIRMVSAEQTLKAGEPVYVECGSVPKRLVLIDTPDFDTGTREGFTNREAATEILTVSDVFLYLVNNTTYNNKSNTDFIRECLTHTGVRKVALLYRCPSVWGDDLVRDHMSVALSNLYPDKAMAESACLGFWRIDESNDVAAGTADPVFRPAGEGKPLQAVLESLDPTKTRAEILQSAIHDLLKHACKWTSDAETEALKYSIYRDALRIITSDHCKKCLKQAPQRDIIRVFSEEWEAAQPWAIRNGHVLSRGAGTIIKTIKERIRKHNGEIVPEKTFGEVFMKTFAEQANALWNATNSPILTFDFSKTGREIQPFMDNLRKIAASVPTEYDFTDKDPGNPNGLVAARVARPAVIPKGNGETSPGKRIVEMAAKAEEIMGNTESVRPGIKALVHHIRDNMTKWQRVKEGFSASLDTVMLVGTVTYVAATGDAFTGGTFLSMFGINDLVTVPALGAFFASKGWFDKELAEQKMNELFATWANDKAKFIRDILEEGITGEAIRACDDRCSRILDVLKMLNKDLGDAARLEKEVF